MAVTNGSSQPAVQDVSERLHVERSSEAFASGAISKVDLPAGALFYKIETATPATKAYTSVQTGPDSHIELNSDLVFCNHSCDPSLEFDMGKMEVRVGRGREIKKGDALTFFYPSSEWDMAQPFPCNCAAKNCCGMIDGARNMDIKQLRRYWLNDHIEQLLAAKHSGQMNGNGLKSEMPQSVDAVRA